MITHKILNRDPKDVILKAFRLLDDDETGKISFKNLKLISDIDDVGSGTICFGEFFKMITHKILTRDPKDVILKAFRLLDDHETGKTSFKYLKLISGVGVDSSGTIGCEEFFKMMTHQILNVNPGGSLINVKAYIFAAWACPSPSSTWPAPPSSRPGTSRSLIIGVIWQGVRSSW